MASTMMTSVPQTPGPQSSVVPAKSTTTQDVTTVPTDMTTTQGSVKITTTKVPPVADTVAMDDTASKGNGLHPNYINLWLIIMIQKTSFRAVVIFYFSVAFLP
jgi:hypothetical protein